MWACLVTVSRLGRNIVPRCQTCCDRSANAHVRDGWKRGGRYARSPNVRASPRAFSSNSRRGAATSRCAVLPTSPGPSTSRPASLITLPAENAEPIVALLGLRSAGKTTVGRRLARRLRVPFVELDRRIEQVANLSLAEIFSLHGEDYYRRLERDELQAVLDDRRPLVLATGGGLVTAAETYALLRRGAVTVWLRATPEDHWNRVLRQGDKRPMADHPQAMSDLRSLLASRETLYALAAHTVDTSGRPVDRIVEEIAGLSRSLRRALRLAATDNPLAQTTLRRRLLSPSCGADP